MDEYDFPSQGEISNAPAAYAMSIPGKRSNVAGIHTNSCHFPTPT